MRYALRYCPKNTSIMDIIIFEDSVVRLGIPDGLYRTGERAESSVVQDLLNVPRVSHYVIERRHGVLTVGVTKSRRARWKHIRRHILRILRAYLDPAGELDYVKLERPESVPGL